MSILSSIVKLQTSVRRRTKRIIKYLIKPYINASFNDLTLTLSKSRLDKELYDLKEPLQALPEVDLTIVSYNSSKWINGFFESLIDQTYPLAKINIFIVDNSSNDNTVEIFNECFTKYGYYFNSTKIIIRPNLGYGSGHDSAINMGKSKYIFITNVDGKLEKDALEKILYTAENDSEKVASWEMRQKPFEHPKYYDAVTLETPWSSYAAVLIRRKAYSTVQGFEKKIFMYGEDVELSYKFRSYGYILKYCPSAVIWHYTYDESQIKPLQYTKSILANSFIRLRYGSLADIMAIPFIYLVLFSIYPKFKGVRKLLLENLKDIAKDGLYYLFSRRRVSQVTFPFRLIDYTIARYGRFVETKEITRFPLVSIIMRVTELRPFDQLKTSILTVANQTYNNIEFIIVEDGGKVHLENCKKLCSNLKLNHKYFSLQKVGRARAGNHGLEASSGEYLMFLDDDDYLLADHLETILSHIVDDNDYVAGYSLAWEAMTDKDSILFDCKNLEVPEALFQEYDFEILTQHNFIPIQSIVFKKQLFIERGGFDESLDYLEDWNLWYRYGYNNKFKFIPKITSIYTVTHNFKEFTARNRLMRSSYYDARLKAQKAIERL